MADNDRSPPIERVAAVTERLAVLLTAGVPPAAAWGYLAVGYLEPGSLESGSLKSGVASSELPIGSASAGAAEAADEPADREETQPLRRRVPPRAGLRRRLAERMPSDPGDPAGVGSVIAAAAAAARDGADVAVAIAEAASGPSRRARRRSGASDREAAAADAWLTVAAAWSVAIETGAPLAKCLHQLARSQRALGQAQRDIDAALAGPRSTSRLVMVLPVIGLLFGLLLGFDTIGTLVGTGPGLVCLTGAALLMFAAWRWSAGMVHRSTPRSSAPSLAVDLTAIAMSSGVSVDRAVTVVESALARFRPDSSLPGASEFPDHDREQTAIGGVLALSRAAGVPAAELLRGEADQLRRDARSGAQQAAASLATRLMLPLGICILPAFMLVGVAPLLLSVLSSTVRGIG